MMILYCDAMLGTVPTPERETTPRTYLLVLVIEALVIATLYWLGRHFG